MEIDLSTGHLQVLDQQQPQQQQEQPQQHSSWLPQGKQQNPVCQRLWATAKDGAQIPITLLHTSDLQCNGQQPLLVEVYGAYGQVLDAEYKSYRVPLLQRGWSVALAHVRGGGELGRR